jgi:hypothetical protein
LPETIFSLIPLNLLSGITPIMLIPSVPLLLVIIARLEAEGFISRRKLPISDLIFGSPL